MSLPAAAEPRPPKSTNGRPLRPPVPAWMRGSFRVTSALLPGVAEAWGRKLFFTPRGVRPRAEEEAVLARAERFSFRAMDDRVEGYVLGSGPKRALFLHGWAGRAGQLAPWMSAFAEAGFQSVGLDLPGHGRSGGAQSSLVHFAEAIERATALHGPFDVVVAHSFGAAGMTLALSRGVPAGRLIYVAPPLTFEPFWHRFREGLGVSDEIWARMMRAAEAWLSVRFADITPDALTPSMRAPLLVVHDRKDSEVPFSEGEALAQRWHGAQLLPTDGLGHVRILRDAGTLAAGLAFAQGSLPASRGV